MQRISLLLLPALCCLLLFSSCSSVPDHARYIPRDATAVIGVNTHAMSKKIAWNAILGSKLLDDMQDKPEGAKAKQAMKDAENAGIDYSSTLYLWVKQDNRYQDDMKGGLVLPLDDAAKWEAFLKKTMPEATITTVKDRKEAVLGSKAYASWTGKVLLINKTLNVKREVAEPSYSDTMFTHKVDTIRRTDWNGVDQPGTAAEMQMAFDLKKENSMLSNDRFADLEKEGNDVTMFLNYGGLMDNVMNGRDAGMGGMLGASMGRTIWENAAFTMGLNFEKGKMTGDMKYYPSDSMRAVSKDFGNDDIDKDLLSRLPGQNLNMLAGYHINPSGLRTMLDKMGMLGLANMGLMQSGMSLDDILGAFTGDIVFSLNNFSMKKQTMEIDSSLRDAMGMNDYSHWEPDMDMTYAMKLKSRANFDKLMTFLNKDGALQQAGKDSYVLPMGDKKAVMTLSDKYLVVSTNPANAQAFLADKGSLPDAAKKEVDGHPIGMYADVQGMLKAVPDASLHGKDSVSFTQLRQLFTTVTLHGGEFKSDASVYHMEVNLVNKEENALIQLMNFVQGMIAAEKAGAPAAAALAPKPAAAVAMH